MVSKDRPSSAPSAADGDRGAGLPGQPADAQRRHRDRHPLRRTQPLFEQQVAERDVHQRVDEVTQAGLDHVVVVDRPDIDQPVQTQQHSRGDETAEHARLAQHGEPGPLLAHRQHDHQEQQRPQHAVRQDLQGRHFADGMEIQGEQAPAQESQGGGKDAGTHGESQIEVRPRLSPN
jgi:hypothetical protein